ncbi:MAG: hypothetical protein Q9170_004894 [Blastenia crenularia]
MRPLPTSILRPWKQLTACRRRQSSSLSDLKQEMTSRKFSKIEDYSSPTPAKLLYSSLQTPLRIQGDEIPAVGQMLPGSHLVYFPPDTLLSSLLPDGTDPLHSPGPPFTRRMWAGGDVTFHKPVIFSKGRITCRESIANVEIKGKDGEEKVYVTIQRNIFNGQRYKEDDVLIAENRRLVFMRDRPPAPDPCEVPAPRRTILKPPHKAQFFRSMTPSRDLLFRFSALTFNAHRIHLDQTYCRDIEGHRNLLVHGPLSLVMMLYVLAIRLKRPSQSRYQERDMITHVNYRCLAPLYAEEELKVCLRQKDRYSWDTWIEGPDGGLAVQGTVKTSAPPASQQKDMAASAKPAPEPQAKVVDDLPTSTKKDSPTKQSLGSEAEDVKEVPTVAEEAPSAQQPLESGTKGVEEIPTTAEEGSLAADDLKPSNSSSTS